MEKNDNYTYRYLYNEAHLNGSKRLIYMFIYEHNRHYWYASRVVVGFITEVLI